MTTQRKPKAPTPHEVDRGGRVFYATRWKVYEARPSGLSCGACAFTMGGKECLPMSQSRRACLPTLNGLRGHRTLHPVQAVG